MDALENSHNPTGPCDEMSGDRDGAHDNIAQRSEYESKAGGSIKTGYNPASVRTAGPLRTATALITIHTRHGGDMPTLG